jgi:hypothetical protein
LPPDDDLSGDLPQSEARRRVVSNEEERQTWRDESGDGSPLANAVPDLARATSTPGAVVGVLGSLALLAWGITWLTLGRWLGAVLVLLGLATLFATGRIIWKLIRARRARSTQ